MKIIAPMTKVRTGDFMGYISEVIIHADNSISYSIEQINEDGVNSISGIYDVQIEILDSIEKKDIGFI